MIENIPQRKPKQVMVGHLRIKRPTTTCCPREVALELMEDMRRA